MDYWKKIEMAMCAWGVISDVAEFAISNWKVLGLRLFFLEKHNFFWNFSKNSSSLLSEGFPYSAQICPAETRFCEHE